MIMNSVEINSLAFQMANVFIKYYKKYTNKHFILSNVKNSKWWPFFIKTAIKFGEREHFNVDGFIKAQFDEYGKVFPFNLPKEDSYKVFLSRNKKQEDFSKIQTINEVLSLYKRIKKWCETKRLDGFSVKSYLDDKKNILFLKRGTHPFTLLSVSKSFLDLNRVENIIENEKIEAKRMLIFTNSKLKSKLQEVLGDEFY
jgi:hypothetical protein